MDTPAFAIAIIVLFHTYVSNKDMSIKKKLLIAYGMTVFLCNFAFSLYPAWQVPLGYLILPFIIIDFIIYRKNLSLKDYLIMIGTIIITAAIVASTCAVPSLPSAASFESAIDTLVPKPVKRLPAATVFVVSAADSSVVVGAVEAVSASSEPQATNADARTAVVHISAKILFFMFKPFL